MKKAFGKILRYTLSALLAALLLFLALKDLDPGVFARSFLQTKWGYIIAAMLCAVAALLLRALRCKSILIPIKDNIEFIDVWDCGNIGNMFSLALPGAGEFARCAYLSKRGIPYSKAFGAVLLERAWDVVMVVIITVIAIAFNNDDLVSFLEEQLLSPMGGRVNLLIALLCGLIALSASLFIIYKARRKNATCEKIARALDGIFAGIAAFGKIPHKFLFLAETCAIWIMYILMAYFTIESTSAAGTMNFIDAVFISAIGNFASIIPVPGGLGTYHYLVALSMSTIYNSTWDMGILVATLSHEGHSIVLLITGLISYVSSSLRGTDQ